MFACGPGYNMLAVARQSSAGRSALIAAKSTIEWPDGCSNTRPAV